MYSHQKHPYQSIPDQSVTETIEFTSFQIDSTNESDSHIHFHHPMNNLSAKDSSNSHLLHSCSLFLFLFFLIAVILTCFIILLVPINDNIVFHLQPVHPDASLYLHSTTTLLYLTVSEQSQQSLFDSSFPLLHGSKLFIRSNPNNECFHLQASNGNYLSIGNNNNNNNNNNQVYFDSDIEQNAAYLLFVKDDTKSSNVFLKVCNRPLWIGESSSLSSSLLDEKSSSSSLVLYSQDTTFIDKFMAIFFRKVVLPSHKLNQNIHSIKLEYTTSILGVNLGGWFIPEVWMRRSFFNDTSLGWAGSLCSMIRYNRSLTEERMLNSLNNWITEQDFQEIKSYGFNSIRIPLGYWNIIVDPYKAYAPTDLDISLHFLDLSFLWAEKYGLSVLLDLHGLPGSQNGIDHSGCGMNPQWLESEQNIALSLKSVDALIKRYASHPSLIGIELANEPGYFYSLNNHSMLLSYYKQAYETIRRYHPTTMIVFNELYDTFYNKWSTSLHQPKYYNVVMDLHLYDWQEPYTSRSIPQHIEDAKAWKQVIEKQRRYHPILIGEWSMSTGTFVQAGQAYVDAAVKSFYRGGALGWYLWNWKIEKGFGFDEWDVQLQMRKNTNRKPDMKTQTSTGLNPLKNA